MRKIYLLSFSLMIVVCTSAQVSKSKPRTGMPIPFEKKQFQMPPALNAPGCDTLLWSPTTIAQYGGTAYVADEELPLDSGIISGTNAYNDKQKGNYFDVSSSANSNYVTKVRFAFARAKSSDMTKTIFFRVYNVGVDTSLAGSSPALPLSTFTGVVGGLADYTFPTPIPLATKKFFISVDFSNLSFAANDSFFLFQNNYNNSFSAPDSAVEQWSNGQWQWMSVAWQLPPTFVYLFPYVSNNSTCTLPVKLTSFGASGVGAYNKLRWTTVAELTNGGFQIERSSDGITFENLQFVKSKALLGSSSQAIEYSFTDENPLEKNNFYRLKQVDNNGKSTFSTVALVNRAGSISKGILAYYPNPVKSILNLQLSASKAGKEMLTVTNMIGAVVMQKNIQTTGNTQTIELNVANLPKGAYFVKLSGEKNAAKFVKD